jgi:hypothetical protein
MKQWKAKLDVSDIWENSPDSHFFIEIGQRVMAVADEMLNNGFISQNDRDDLWSLGDALKCIEDVNDFDSLWDEIYDWADVDKRLWIKIEKWM